MEIAFAVMKISGENDENQVCYLGNWLLIHALTYVESVSALLHSLSNHNLCRFNSYSPRLSLAEVLIFSLMFSQALFTSSSTFKFSKAANLFVISI